MRAPDDGSRARRQRRAFAAVVSRTHATAELGERADQRKRLVVERVVPVADARAEPSRECVRRRQQHRACARRRAEALVSATFVRAKILWGGAEFTGNQAGGHPVLMRWLLERCALALVLSSAGLVKAS